MNDKLRTTTNEAELNQDRQTQMNLG